MRPNILCTGGPATHGKPHELYPSVIPNLVPTMCSPAFPVMQLNFVAIESVFPAGVASHLCIMPCTMPASRVIHRQPAVRCIVQAMPAMPASRAMRSDCTRVLCHICCTAHSQGFARRDSWGRGNQRGAAGATGMHNIVTCLLEPQACTVSLHGCVASLQEMSFEVLIFAVFSL